MKYDKNVKNNKTKVTRLQPKSTKLKNCGVAKFKN